MICPICGKKNPADIHTCRDPVLKAIGKIEQWTVNGGVYATDADIQALKDAHQAQLQRFSDRIHSLQASGRSHKGEVKNG